MSDKLGLLVLMVCQAGHQGGGQVGTRPGDLLPRFDSHLPATMTVQQGDTAYLPCRIFNAHNM